MKDYELIGALLVELEEVAQELPNITAMNSAPPVNTQGSEPESRVPTLLIDDTDAHVPLMGGDGVYQGNEYDDDGNFLGKILKFRWKATPEFVARTGHETDMYKSVDLVKQRVYRLIEDTKLSDQVWKEDVRSFTLGNEGPYNRKPDFSKAVSNQDRTFTRALPVEIEYVDRIIYDGGEPVETFINKYQATDGDGESSSFQNTVDSSDY